ncbi:MAG: ferritin-like domain-containing protein [Pyrinomonadaceae bacterium]|nr:ferritin-like domain-containing protein [Pyrinomonadaceae bacterium]
MFLKLSVAAVAAIAFNGATGNVLARANNGFFSIPIVPQTGAVDLGSGDTGILNYAYALEQLEAAFYTQVIQTPFKGMTPQERQLLTDLRDHEIVHREFLKTALGAGAIPGLTPNFAAIKFDNRKSVLTTAQTFEDLGVAAYNGAGKLLKNADFLVLAGKIVSVEARHAAAIADLIKPNSKGFATNSLDGALDPPTVLKAAAPFISTPITANNLPKA